MGRWRHQKEQFTRNEIYEADGDWIGDAINKVEAAKLVAAHNADCDAYEARIAELESGMERQREAIRDREKGELEACAEIDTIRADLIAAGCLVPVPAGGACRMTGISMFSLFTCDHDGVWLKFGLDSWHYYARNIITGEETALLDSAIVQPVRLVRLEEVG